MEVLQVYAVDVAAYNPRVAHETALDTVGRERYMVVGNTAAGRCSAWGPVVVDEEADGSLLLGCLWSSVAVHVLVWVNPKEDA